MLEINAPLLNSLVDHNLHLLALVNSLDSMLKSLTNAKKMIVIKPLIVAWNMLRYLCFQDKVIVFL